MEAYVERNLRHEDIVHTSYRGKGGILGKDGTRVGSVSGVGVLGVSKRHVRLPSPLTRSSCSI